MQKIFLIVFILLIISFSSLQSYVKINVGISYLQMDPSQYSELNNEIMKSAPFDVKLVDDYPEQPCYTIDLHYFSTHFEAGLFYSSYSTGSRLDYTDYSGSYRVDNIVNYSRFGIDLLYYSKDIEESKECFSLFFGFELGIGFNSYESTEKYLLPTANSTHTNEIYTTSAYTKPKVGIVYKYEILTISAYLGYNIELNNGKYGDWTGFNPGISLGVFFPLF